MTAILIVTEADRTRAAKLHQIGRSLRRNGCLDKAEDAFRAALRLAPGSAVLRVELISLLREAADWRHFAAEQAWLHEQVAQGTALPGLTALLAGIDAPGQQLNARRWREHYGRPAAVTRPSTIGDGRIRLGYLSADFQAHATAWLIAEVLERHDRGRFQVTAYSIGPDADGPERRRLAAAVERFVDLGLDLAVQLTHLGVFLFIGSGIPADETQCQYI